MSFAGAMAGMQGAGALVQAFGSIKSGFDTAQAYSDQAKLALWEGIQNAETIRLKGEETMGMQTAMTGASGVAMSGSSLDFMADQAYQWEKERYRALLQAWYQAHQAKEAAKDAKIGGYLGAASSILGGFFGVAKALKK